jgi:acetoacetyl-CoA synthetase
MDGTVLHRPAPEAASAAQISAFRRKVEGAYGVSLPDTRALHAFSIERIPEFWSAVWDFCEVIGDRGATAARDLHLMPGARFFPEARLSFAENLLRRSDDEPALIACDERGVRRVLSFRALRMEVGRVQSALRTAGVAAGDRVAAYLPNIPETVIYALAASSLGAVFSSCSPDFGAAGAVDRFGQIEPRMLVAADGYSYGGKPFDVLPKVKEIAAQIPSIERTVIVPHLGRAPHLSALSGAVLHDELVRAHPPTEPEFERLPFDHPLYVLYSSGTTGKPKCIVHRAGGTLLQHLKEHRLHVDLRPGERLLYFTTCGWMMWNWLVSGLASGACLVLYDGSPFHPGPAALFDLADREQVNVFGTSAKFLDGIAKAGIRPRETHDLGSVRTILSTGSPLAPESLD